VILAQVDLPNAVAGNSSLTGNRGHEVRGLHSVACSDGHEKAGRATRPTSFTLGPFLRRRQLILSRGTSERTFPLEHMQRRSRKLGRVVLLEERLQRNHFPRRYTLRENGAKFLTHRLLAIVRTTFGA
jgi:hypothetical protein